jgi:uncharacterized membrane protein HdeD (DUF308 family)
MDSIVERARRVAGSELSRLRWALGIQGLLWLAFGVVILVWPGISLHALVIVFGAFSLANGIVMLGTAIGGRGREGRGWLALSGVLAIAIGVLVFVWPGISALALLYVIGAYALALGVLAVGGGIWLPLDGGDRALLALTGLVSVLFGIVIFAKPGDGALVLLALIAAFALVRGIAELVVAIGWKRLAEGDIKRTLARAKQRLQPAS